MGLWIENRWRSIESQPGLISNFVQARDTDSRVVELEMQSAEVVADGFAVVLQTYSGDQYIVSESSPGSFSLQRFDGSTIDSSMVRMKFVNSKIVYSF